ncbi:MAG: LysR family transcriptional regulator [Gammaproteobacteria bacterium]|nr:LysR family transcriptional regulator [Gammaproteobacteria bacterium]
MKAPKVALEQWRVLQAVIDHDGYAQAAEHLHRSQSSVSYTVSKLQEQLGVSLLQIEGRKAVLTEVGEVLLRRSRQLVEDAAELEQFAYCLEEGWEAEIDLVVDAAFPSCYLMAALKQFIPVSRGTRVQLNEVVLSGADEALLEGRADLVIGSRVPKGFLGNSLIKVEFIAVAHKEHPLHQLQRVPTHKDLRKEMQVVIRDSGLHMKRDSGWLGSEYRWTVSSIDTAVETVSSGLGFGWLPKHKIESLLDGGTLKPLKLKEGQQRATFLYLIFGHPESVGPATQQLADIFSSLVDAEE